MNVVNPTARTPLRRWPGVAIVTIQWLLRFVVPAAAPHAQIFGVDTQLLAMVGGIAGWLGIIVWWVFFSRAPWSDRLGALVVMTVAIAATRPFTHPSIQNGMMGMMFVVYAIPPTLSLGFVVWAVASRRLSAGVRRTAMVAAILLGCAVWTLARTDGLLGGTSQLAWRWTPTAEERLLAQAGPEPAPLPSSPSPASANPSPDAPGSSANATSTPAAISDGRSAADASEKAAPPAALLAPARATASPMRAEWPGFRGPNRDGLVRGVRIRTDWTTSPPVQVWRRPLGPGWSSLAVSGDLLYTQEQRGDDEIVAAYKVSTGEPVWRHRDRVRFWESNGGAGPRATPTLSNGRVYTFGATGIVNALNAANGTRLWSRDAASDTGRKVPDWGFASSPLVVDDVVIVAVAGTLVGYNAATGERRWSGPSYGGSYSSPHRIIVDGVVQVLLLGGPGAISVAPADGSVLWEHAWSPGAIVQPAVTADGDVLINGVAATGGLGTRRLAITHRSAEWTVEERWTSNGLKPYFNDFVVHKGHAYGFDGNILACIDLQDGTRKWKGGRYGNGQMILLPDQDVLLVLSEEGEMALVSATADHFTELARRPALEGKTWNHPALVGDLLLVRNGQEMAAFRLALESR